MEYLWILAFLVLMGLIISLLVKYLSDNTKEKVWLLYAGLSGVGLTYIVRKEFINRNYVGMEHFEQSTSWFVLMGILFLEIVGCIVFVFISVFVGKIFSKFFNLTDMLEDETSNVTKKKTTI
ncbi:hypothetical protein [Priestia megaterium]|uniref:Uncharacterized protein n=1 Tax=Priestia megaterium TaxID=1404 RepID=A0A6M6E171_PRIMG|nr:hypothetical protein [Priestia megaterium]QJX80803.1 hypothetical protein FDZ14_32455 [Priestia megaterium]